MPNEYVVPPSPVKREIAEKLGIGHLITHETSALRTARLIENALGSIQREHEIANQLKKKKQDMEKIAELIQNGLSIGARAAYCDSVRCTVSDFNVTSGEVLLSYRRGFAQRHGARNIKIIQTAQDPRKEPDSWAPAGYERIHPALAAQVARGVFGEMIESALVTRDSFFLKTRYAFLPKEAVESINKIRLAEKNLHALARTPRTQKYCIQCGKLFERVPSCTVADFAKSRRCDECKDKSVSLHTIYCAHCGIQFARSAKSVALCERCRNTTAA